MGARDRVARCATALLAVWVVARSVDSEGGSRGRARLRWRPLSARLPATVAVRLLPIFAVYSDGISLAQVVASALARYGGGMLCEGSLPPSPSPCDLDAAGDALSSPEAHLLPEELYT
eukprot:gene27993-52982_t